MEDTWMNFNDPMELTVTFTGVGRQHVPMPLDEEEGKMDKAMQNEIDKLKADCAELERKYESLGEDFTGLVDTVHWKREEIDQLKAELQSLKNENALLAGDIIRLKREKDFLSKRLEGKKVLRQRMKSMKHELDASKEHISSLKSESEYVKNLAQSLRDENLALAYENAALKKWAQANRPCKASQPTDEEKKAHSDLLDAFSYAYYQWEERAKGPNPGCRCSIQPYLYFGECKCADKDAEIAELKAENDKLREKNTEMTEAWINKRAEVWMLNEQLEKLKTTKCSYIAELQAKVDSLSRSLKTEKSASEVQRVRLYEEIEALTEKNADMKRTLDFFGLPV